MLAAVRPSVRGALIYTGRRCRRVRASVVNNLADRPVLFGPPFLRPAVARKTARAGRVGLGSEPLCYRVQTTSGRLSRRSGGGRLFVRHRKIDVPCGGSIEKPGIWPDGARRDCTLKMARVKTACK